MLERLAGFLGWWFGWLVILSFWPVFRLRVSNRQAIPRTGPFLLLPNHTSVMDPGWAAWRADRKMHFMASSNLFRSRVLGRLLSILGAFPKERFVKDRDSMAELQRLWDLGRGITIFSEGLRTWDGRTQRPSGGIGRLIKRLKGPVVFARIKSGHLFQPRWADYPRWVSVHVEYEGPVTWPDEATAEEITADVARYIAIPDDYDPGGTQLGFRMAHGLPAYLWACPACFTLEGLEVASDDAHSVRCESCGARWTVDCAQRMKGESMLNVASAHDRIVEHFGDRPGEGSDPLLRVDDGSVVDLRSPDRAVVASGTLILRSERLLVLGDGTETWGIALADITLVLLEVNNALHIRTEDRLLKLQCGDQSPLKWAHFMERWREAGP